MEKRSLSTGQSYLPTYLLASFLYFKYYMLYLPSPPFLLRRAGGTPTDDQYQFHSDMKKLYNPSFFRTLAFALVSTATSASTSSIRIVYLRIVYLIKDR